MSCKSVFERMNPAVRAELDRMMAEGRLTLTELHEYLKAQGPEALELEAVPSRSSIHRRQLSFKEEAERLRQEREATAALVQELGPESTESEHGRFLVEMLRTLVSQFLRAKVTDRNGTYDSKEMARIAKTVRDLSHTMRLEQDFDAKLKEAARKEAEAKLEQAVQDVAKETGEAQLTPLAVLERVKAIYRGEA